MYVLEIYENWIIEVMSFEIRYVDELVVYVVDGIILGVDVFNILVGLSDVDIFLCDVILMVDFEIEELEEYEMEYLFEIICVNFFRFDFMIDYIGSFLNFVVELECLEIIRFEEFEIMFEVEVLKNIVEFCSVDINVGSLFDVVLGLIFFEFEEGEEVRMCIYVEVVRVDFIVYEFLIGNNGVGGFFDVVIVISVIWFIEEVIKEGNCVEELVVYIGVGDSIMDVNGGGGLEELVYDMRLGDIREEVFKEGDYVKKLVFDVVVGDIMKVNFVFYEEGN